LKTADFDLVSTVWEGVGRGVASSLAAVAGVSDLDVAMLVSRRRVAEYMDATGRDFRDLVLAKRERHV
jgi:hypothetical protein